MVFGRGCSAAAGAALAAQADLNFGRFRPIFSGNRDDLRLGVDRLFASSNVMHRLSHIPRPAIAAGAVPRPSMRLAKWLIVTEPSPVARERPSRLWLAE